MKLLFKIFLLVSLLFFKVESINALDFEAQKSDVLELCQKDYSYNDNSSALTQSISSIKITVPRSIEYNFNLERVKIKNTSFNKLIFHFPDTCKVLQASHMEKGLFYKIVHYVRHSSKYYIFALRHILI